MLVQFSNAFQQKEYRHLVTKLYRILFRYKSLVGLRIIALAAVLFYQPVHGMAQKLSHLLVGTYTNKKSEGIYIYSFNKATGEVKYEHTIKGVSNPSYLAISSNNNFIYSVEENSGQPGKVSAFAFNRQTGAATFLNSRSSGSEGPCYVSVSETGSDVFVGNYTGGSLAVLHVRSDGSLDSSAQNIFHQGSSINKERQEHAHVHSVVLSPDNHFLMVPDLGLDKVMIYRFDPANDLPLTPARPDFVGVKPGAGPRHIVFHPNGKFAYITEEMSGSVTAFAYANGKLSHLQTISMLSVGFKGNVGAADIHVSPDAKFLYASNRGDANEIVIYAIQPVTGMLKYVGRQSTFGKTPRNFLIDPSGNFLLVANQNSDNIFIFKRNSKTGLLSLTKSKLEIDSPVCLKIIDVD